MKRLTWFLKLPHQLGCRWRHTVPGVPKCTYDVIVVGGGHAGTEAAHAAARMGVNTLLVTHKVETIGEMSCSPSFGGIGKGHLMKEVDALGGVCARICDKAGIQYKVLNKKKGPAVWGPRAQIDRELYRKHIQEEILNTPNLSVVAAPVEDLVLVEAAQPDHQLMKLDCWGVILGNGEKLMGKTVVLTTGTFLRGCINIGLTTRLAGRVGDEPAIGLAKSLEEVGFTMGRLKTGTPPRLDGAMIDFTKTLPMKGDNPPQPFSFMNEDVWIKSEDQRLCHMTFTNEKVDKIVLDTLHLNKHIKEDVLGPRYCPSLESKVLRFKGRRHQIWLEPEGLNTSVVYPSGISCTMPEAHQVELVRCIKGLERCELIHPGYGVEYDFMDPRQLKNTLETFRIRNLFFAGQINGTTGYEEAAAQGIVAGINAALKTQNKAGLIVDRTEGYIGVLIDDLITQGTSEPYRMFTSRAEFRLSLRPDNADLRLTEKGFIAGCVDSRRYKKMQQVKADLEENLELLKSVKQPMYKWHRDLELDTNCKKSIQRSAFEALFDPRVTVKDLDGTYPDLFGHLSLNPILANRLKIEVKYAAGLQDQLREIEEVRKEEQLSLPDDLDYMSLRISNEAKTKLAETRPQTIAAASRIPGMTPSAVLILLYHVKRLRRKDAQPACTSREIHSLQPS